MTTSLPLPAYRPARVRPGPVAIGLRALLLSGVVGGVVLGLEGAAAASVPAGHLVAHLSAVPAAPDIATLAEGAGPDGGLRTEAALAGYLSYGLMAMTVVWGILLATGWVKRIARYSAVHATHMTLALTAQTFAVMHALSYIFQTQENFSIAKTFIPFVQGGEIEVALGIVGLELMIGASVAVALTHKLNYRRFRKAHIGGTYVGAALSWVHVLATSPEARAPGLVGITVAAAALACIALGVIRLLPPSRADRARIAVRPLASVSA